MKKVNVCLLGASGAVGKEMLKILQERKFPVNELRLLGNKTAGQKVIFNNKEYTIEKPTKDSFKDMDITLVAVGSDESKKLSPLAAKAGSVVIDNSSAFRMDKNVPLVVPEVNPEDVKLHKGIIANPNCSTIIALVALAPLHKFAKIKRIIASTYQAVSGAGKEGMEELQQQVYDYAEQKKLSIKAFKYQILFNLIPQIDAFDNKTGYTKEELKMTNEGRKILHAPASQFKYPMPLDTTDQDNIFVGRIREDISAKNSLTFWCAGDQIRKGAATNAVQIAELVLPLLDKEAKKEEAPKKRVCKPKKAAAKKEVKTSDK